MQHSNGLQLASRVLGLLQIPSLKLQMGLEYGMRSQAHAPPSCVQVGIYPAVSGCISVWTLCSGHHQIKLSNDTVNIIPYTAVTS